MVVAVSDEGGMGGEEQGNGLPPVDVERIEAAVR